MQVTSSLGVVSFLKIGPALRVLAQWHHLANRACFFFVVFVSPAVARAKKWGVARLHHVDLYEMTLPLGCPAHNPSASDYIRLSANDELVNELVLLL